MPFVPGNDVAQVELRFLWSGQRVENTMYFQGIADWISTSMELLALQVESWWLSNVQALVSDQVELQEVFVTNLDTATSGTWSQPTTPGTSGARVSPALPNNVSCALSFRTAGRGRSSRGRNYVLGLTEDQVSNNTLLTSEAIGYTNAYGVWLTAVIPNSANWVVFSRFTNGAPRVVGLAQQILSVGFADLTIDSQRRRLPGRGT